ncbi:MAG: LytTR family DNA-binding domain-containing protein [Bacilli bacterium]
MIKAAVVEDSQEASETIIEFIRKYGEETKTEFQVQHFPNGLNFLDEFHSQFDIVFMDIQMPFMDGMEVSHKLREKDENVKLIFVTNMGQYAIKGYEVDALAYMVKPITYYNFRLILDKTMKSLKRNREKMITINSDSGIIKVNLEDILYIEVSNHDLFYHTEENEYQSRDSLSRVENELISDGFAKCNKSFLVNLRHVKKIDNESVFVGKYILKVSRTKKKEFSDAFVNYIGDTI